VLTLSFEVRDGVCTVDVVGEVDHLSAEELRQVALGALQNGASSLVLDCSELSFIDSSGLTVLIEAQQAAAAQAGTVTVRDPSPFMLRLVETTRLDEVVIIEPPPGASGG
jgi:anti-sigma B factor antagonist